MHPTSRHSLGIISLLAGIVLSFVPGAILYKSYSTNGALVPPLWPAVFGALFALAAMGLIWKGVFYLCASDEAILRHEQKLREANLGRRSSFVRDSFAAKQIADEINYLKMFGLFSLGSFVAIYAALSNLALGRFFFRYNIFEKEVLGVIGAVPPWFRSFPQVPEDWALALELTGGVVAVSCLIQVLFYLPQRFRFGRSDVLFERYPLMLGEVARGKFQGRWLRSDFESFEAILTLSILVDDCSSRFGEDRRRSKKRKVVESWPVTLKRPVAGLDSYLPFEVMIEPNSEIEGYIMWEACHWRMKLCARRPGLDFRRAYRIKVMLSPESGGRNSGA